MVKEFSYIGIGRTPYNRILLLFDAGVVQIAFEVRDKDSCYIYEVEKSNVFENGVYFKKNFKSIYLHKTKEKTVLEERNEKTNFKGEAFNYDAELVAIKLEEV